MAAATAGAVLLGSGVGYTVWHERIGDTPEVTAAAAPPVGAEPRRTSPTEPRQVAASRAAVRPACAVAATMPLRAALAQTLMVGVRSPSRRQLDLLLKGPTVGGLFLHGDGTRLLTDGRMRRVAAASPRPLVSTDDEGGRVQRLRALAGHMPSARTQAESMSPAQVRKMAEQRGDQLRRYGITMSLAPTADVSDQGDREVIGDRSYSADPNRATRYARAFAAGLRAAGVLPTLKHFPGHGRAAGDSHDGRATTPRAKDLRGHDWIPYRELVGTEIAVMMGHLSVPGLSRSGLPASLDPALYRILRDEIGFNGLVVTDELAGMRAVRDRFTLRQAIRRALAAGADQALFLAAPASVEPLLDRLTADVRKGRLDEARVREAAGRVLAVKGCPPPAARAR